MEYKFTFIDLFAGIGGFHLALKKIGGECVFASEIDKKAQEVYKKNFPNTNLHGDIYKCLDDIPNFDILTAGFPCQPFSHAGKQKGFEDEKNGNLFFVIVEILKKHPECKAFILENVKQISNPKYWNVIQKELSKLNFHITLKPFIISPTFFGIPQNRPRVYIIGIKKDLTKNKNIDEFLSKLYDWEQHNNTFLPLKMETIKPDFVKVNWDLENKIYAWIEFVKITTQYEKITFPIWIEYFGYGIDENNKYYNDIWYGMPKWKAEIAKKNRAFYLKHKYAIDCWIIEYEVINWKPSYKKMEWQYEYDTNSYKKYFIEIFKKPYDDSRFSLITWFFTIKNLVIQQRPSGIRFKNKRIYPALTAYNSVPLIFSKGNNSFSYLLRKITPYEAGQLQGFNRDFKFSSSITNTYKQLGNSVNVDVIKYLTMALLNNMNGK